MGGVDFIWGVGWARVGWGRVGYGQGWGGGDQGWGWPALILKLTTLGGVG